LRFVVVEDNESLAKGIAYRLRDAGHAVDLIHDGLQADEFLARDDSEIVILDVNLPGLDGISVLQNMRARSDQRPVLLLTARSETTDRIKGLDAGADDYLVKPFDMDELEARLRALARRRTQSMPQTQNIGSVTFDVEARQLLADGITLDIPRREIAVFECLLAAKGRTVSKERLLERVYGTGTDVEESAIEVYISRLRRRLGKFGVGIQVQRGLGYQLLEKDRQ